MLSGPGDVLFLQDRDDSTRWQAYDITATPTDVPANSYVSIPVTHREGGSALIDQAVIAQVLWGGGDSGGGSATGTKMTDLTAQTGAGLATTDIMETVDLSDTTMHSSGTNKKLAMSDLITFLNNNGIGGTPAASAVSFTPVSTIAATNVQAAIAEVAAEAGAGTVVKLTDLSALGASAATGDLIEVVDISDTTMAASGTNKKLTLAELVTFVKTQLRTVPNNQAGTTFAPALTDEATFVRFTGSSAVTVTMPQDSAVAFPDGAEIHFVQAGTDR